MKILKQDEAALWRCEPCDVWWCSQPVRSPTSFLLSLPLDQLEEMGWDNFRGWQLGGTPHVATCPECGIVNVVVCHGTASSGPPLMMSLAALLRPIPAFSHL